MGWFLFLIPVALAAETDMARGLFRGTLESVVVSGDQGRISARSSGGATSSCAYDARTYMEADRERVEPQRLRTGDLIVVVADHRPGTRTCYARTLHVVAPPPPTSRRVRPVVNRPPAIRIRGNLTFSGRVASMDSARLTLRTADGEVALALRPDTAYLGEGELQVNRYVAVRAGRSLTGALEAYQVSWAELLRTGP